MKKNRPHTKNLRLCLCDHPLAKITGRFVVLGKKIFLYVIVCLFILVNFGSPALAQYKNQEKIPGASQQQSDFVPYIKDIIGFGYATIGILAMFMLCIGAYQYLMAAGNIGKVESARNTIGSAIFGLVLGLLSWIILSKIHPDLVAFKNISVGGQ